MFDQVDGQRGGGMPWGVIGAAFAMAALLAAGYVLIS